MCGLTAGGEPLTASLPCVTARVATLGKRRAGRVRVDYAIALPLPGTEAEANLRVVRAATYPDRGVVRTVQRAFR